MNFEDVNGPWDSEPAGFKDGAPTEILRALFSQYNQKSNSSPRQSQL